MAPAWLEPEEPLETGVHVHRPRHIRARRVAVLAMLAAAMPMLALPRLVEAVELELTTLHTTDGIVRVLADDAGHRFDQGRVREVEAGVDGTLWVAVGRRVLALGTPGAVEPLAQGWEAFPRRISARPDGELWAVQDGGGSVRLTPDGWTIAEPPPADDPDEPTLDEEALQALQAAGQERTPRVLAAVEKPGGQRWLLVDVSARHDVRPAKYRLLRFDGTSWTVLGPADGMPRDELGPWTVTAPQSPIALAVDQLGRAWFSLDQGGLWVADDDGVQGVDFPGLGTGALDLASTPDGAIWIASARGHLFRWAPEAEGAL